jgi:glycosyltransferase involved in cell wall biosynthesis
MLPVRDEGDIIQQCLQHLLTWADAIYVFDTGSVDDTWEIVQDFASKDRRVIPLKKEAVFFSDPVVRGWIFHQARERMQEGDWFVRVDADEFYHIAPPEFVRHHLRRGETIVWHQYYDFRLTESEVKAWEDGRETLQDRQKPIESRRQWFTAGDYSEPRLCRYRASMRWPTTHSFPYNAGYVARQRLPIRHYPHRDPEQLQRRVRLRAIMIANYNECWTQPENHHWATGQWRQFIVPDDLAELRCWKPGLNLPALPFKSHLQRTPIRLVQKLVHTFCLPFLDRTRPVWPERAHPLVIPPEINRTLERELRV